MTFTKMKEAIKIISKCDSLSITEDDKRIIISVFGTIIKSVMQNGFTNTEIHIKYAILKASTWNNGYFCAITKQMCSNLYPFVDICQKYFEV